MYDFNFRTYDAAIGRFLQVDLLADWAPSWTPYRFGFDNPITYWDPLGLFESKREARRYRREERREARRNGESYSGAKVKKNKEGRYELRYQGSDGYVTKTESGELEYGAVASYTGPAIRGDKSNFFELVESQGGFMGEMVYGIADDGWLTVQRFNPFDTHTTHLSGDYASRDEYTMGFINTAATFVPVGRGAAAVKSVAPRGIIITNRLNAAQFSKVTKGTAIARMHPKSRGRLNRLTNKGIDKANNKVETGNILFSPVKSLGNKQNEK